MATVTVKSPATVEPGAGETILIDGAPENVTDNPLRYTDPTGQVLTDTGPGGGCGGDPACAEIAAWDAFHPGECWGGCPVWPAPATPAEVDPGLALLAAAGLTSPTAVQQALRARDLAACAADPAACEAWAAAATQSENPRAAAAHGWAVNIGLGATGYAGGGLGGAASARGALSVDNRGNVALTGTAGVGGGAEVGVGVDLLSIGFERGKNNNGISGAGGSAGICAWYGLGGCMAFSGGRGFGGLQFDIGVGLGVAFFGTVDYTGVTRLWDWW